VEDPVSILLAMASGALFVPGACLYISGALHREAGIELLGKLVMAVSAVFFIASCL
jgi:hypothetical protein